MVMLLSSALLFAIENKEDNNSKPLSQVEKFTQTLKKQLTRRRTPILKNISNQKILKKLYLENKYVPLWISNQGLDKPKYQQLFETVSKDLTLSKNGFIYKHNQELISQIDNNLTQNEWLKMELKLSSHYYNFLKHTLYGEIEWRKFSSKLKNLKKYKINASWIRYKPNHNLVKLLSQPNIKETIKEITPKRFGYNSLLQALERLTQMEKDGGWKKLPYFKRLKLGSTGDIVIQLKERLKYSGDYKSCENKPKKMLKTLENNETNLSKPQPLIEKVAIFDNCLDLAVKKFQKRHGLDVDGIVGGATRKALNVSVEEKIKTVLLNIDRIKWLPREAQKRYLIVNIPEFMLYYIEHERANKKLRVITGDTKHPTPIFSEEISYIVLNPYWKIPEGIVKREIIPSMIKDPSYLKKQGIQAHTTWSERSPRVNVSGLFWEEYLYGNKRFPYRLMQPPGPRNALGKIKFKFPNRFAVYLHDTPTRYLFKRTRRAFSHGCVRLSNPVSLLETIASFNEDINMTKANKRLKGKRKQLLNVNNKLPIHIVYLTAGINSDNELSFRNDIYRYDKFMKRTIR
jgi:murein L,D-transpeptidase YcbB/YkuD